MKTIIILIALVALPVSFVGAQDSIDVYIDSLLPSQILDYRGEYWILKYEAYEMLKRVLYRADSLEGRVCELEKFLIIPYCKSVIDSLNKRLDECEENTLSGIVVVDESVWRDKYNALRDSVANLRWTGSIFYDPELDYDTITHELNIKMKIDKHIWLENDTNWRPIAPIGDE